MTTEKQQNSHRPPTDSGMAKEEFIRVGTTLYKIVEQPKLNGGYVRKRIAWNNETLRQDYGKDYIGSVPKYDGFCTVPEHVSYQRNRQVPQSLRADRPPTERGVISPSIARWWNTSSGSNTNWGWIIFNCSTCNPYRSCPSCCWYRKNATTGKSTFLNFLKALFQNNVTFNTNEDFRSQFNSDWAGKLLIVVDEVLLSRREDSERLKNLSTALSYKVEAKGKDRDEIAFFAKFVLCSNNEYLPVIIDAGETRYWVRRIDRLQSDDTDFLQKLKAEIPAFLHHLQHRQLSTEKESRMWFAPSLLHTEALQRIIRSNRNRLEIEMHELILDIMESVGTDTFSFCPNDLLVLLTNTQVKAEKHQVRKVLQECWKLTPAQNGLTYTTYQLNYNRECRYEPIRRVGRFYTVTRQQLESL